MSKKEADTEVEVVDLNPSGVGKSHLCLGCRKDDNHPKVHILYGINPSSGDPDWAHFHHDCTEDSQWHEQLVGDASGEGERFRHLIDKANSGVRGESLRAYIQEHLESVGTGPRNASGLDAGMGNILLDAIHPTGAITINGVTVTGPFNVRAMSANGANDNAAGTEITTGSGYTSGGTGLGAPTWAAAATVSNIASKSTNATLTKTNMPARTIVGLEEWSSDGTPKRGMWGSVTSLTTNIGDTVSIASGALTDTFA